MDIYVVTGTDLATVVFKSVVVISVLDACYDGDGYI